jgi:hypothetical protein
MRNNTNLILTLSLLTFCVPFRTQAFTEGEEAATVCEPEVHGVCGWSDSRRFVTEATHDVCSTADASTVTDNRPWERFCKGRNSGMTVSYSASVEPANGLCGTANDEVVSAAPAIFPCSTGNASTDTGDAPSDRSRSSTDGGTVAQPSAPLAGAVTVTPATFGMNYIFPLSVSSQIPASIQRMWDSNFLGQPVHWRDIETARGVYNWTSFDAILESIVSKGQDVIYTFGSVPAWANGGAGPQVPPTNMQDLYDFVTAVVARANGRIKYYGTWNEANDPIQYWSGTMPQLITAAAKIYSIVHTLSPNSLVLSPSGSVYGPNSGILWLQKYLAGGGGTYADIIDMHLYFLSAAIFNPTPPTTPPEQYWLAVHNIKSAMTLNGAGSKPLFVDEGGWTTPVQVPSTVTQTEIASTWTILLSSGGVSRMLWYAYDTGANGWGNLSNGSSLNARGTALREAENWLLGGTFTSNVQRVAETNAIRNPAAAGASAGTPGRVATNWGMYNPDASRGISTQIVGSGTEADIPYLDLRVSGTATAGAVGQIQVFFEGGQHIAARKGQHWTVSLYAKVVGGSTNACSTNLAFNENDASGNYVGTALFYPFNPIGAPLETGVQSWAAPSTHAKVTFVQPYLSVGYGIGTPCDVTLRIGSPSMDKGSLWSGKIAKAGGYAGQIIWDANGGPTAYTASDVYTSQRNASGVVTPIVGHTVTLTGQPLLLQNQK